MQILRVMKQLEPEGLSRCTDYVIRVISPEDDMANAWNALLQASHPGLACAPFMRFQYLAALHRSGSACPASGWTPHWLSLWQGHEMMAAAPLYLKTHSYGEYVFDWAWANAFEQHGLAYYPKAVVAVPFTPVPGPRLLARNPAWRRQLVSELLAFCKDQGVSSLHVLFASEEDLAATAQPFEDSSHFTPRHTVQFHWQNVKPMPAASQAFRFADFEDFLGSLNQEKRKKIRQERRKVTEAGVVFRALRGTRITTDHWDFFYRCYAQTYLEHGNPPYLTRDFFKQLQEQQAGQWLMFVAYNERGEPIAASLVALSDESDSPQAAFGRYWGALERVECLHFEACYYQPLQWCMAHGVQRFEGGAQGEHKMARALLPVTTHSAHWLAHPAFADAVDRFLEREETDVLRYLEHLETRSPFRAGPQ
ncbi:MAG: hypothetical protein RL323_643 [Pseudomonadota bacterium]